MMEIMKKWRDILIHGMAENHGMIAEIMSESPKTLRLSRKDGCVNLKCVILLVGISSHLFTLVLQTLTPQTRTVLKRLFPDSPVNYFLYNFYMLTLENPKSNISFNLQKKADLQGKSHVILHYSDIKIYGSLNQKVVETSGKHFLGVKNIVETIKKLLLG